MKLLNIDWWQFLESLEMYRKLPAGGRRMFIEQVKPSQASSQKALGPWCGRLVESGLMALGQTGVNATVKPENREFSRAVRAMSRAKVFSAPSTDHFLDYLNDNLTGSEAASLDGAYYYGRMGYADLNRLFSDVCSAAWIKAFLSAKSANWERDYADPAQPRYFTLPAVFEAAQQLVRAASVEEGPLPIDRLRALCGDVAPEIFSAAMRGILRYLLMFTALRTDDLEPVAGFWPGVAERLVNKPIPPPGAVKVYEPFQGTFLVDDMVAVLSACSAEPLRIRSGDMQIFEADQKNLVAGLGSLPEWIEHSFQSDADYRISNAVAFLGAFRFVERQGKPGSAYRLAPTPEGSVWLTKTAKERLRFLFDELRSGKDAPHAVPLLPGITSIGTRSDSDRLVPAVMAAYEGLPEVSFFRLSEFLSHQARSNNSLHELMKGDRQLSLLVGRTYVSASSEDQVEIAWQNALSSFLKFRLAPLGGVQLAVEPGANNICFAMTAAGRYLIGAAPDFSLPATGEARILVQPNFDVVFLAPSVSLEAELARFCERKGRHVGTLFRITKTSILGGAAAGLTAEQIVQTLRAHSTAEMPANVASEIAGWLRRFREVTMRQSVIVNCPDEATAVNFIAIMGKSVTRLTPTVLELHDSKIQPAVAKKLRDAGIFVRSR